MTAILYDWQCYFINKKGLKELMKISNVWMTFTVLCIPIVFHGTLENFIVGWATVKIFFSVAYRQGYNF
jgi:hypothetical protein